MTVHEHRPVPEFIMYEVYPEYTVCQVLRDTYQMTEDPTIKMNLRVAVGMVKAMDKKLREYKKDWDDGWWAQTKQYREVAKP